MNKRVIYFICIFITACISEGHAQEENTGTFTPIHRVSAFWGMSILTNADDNLAGQITVYGKHKTLFTNLTFRYDFLFKQNWGIYAECFIPGTDEPEPSEWIPRMENNAKGYDYTYTGDADKGNYSCNIITIGVDYCQKLKSWDLQPSVGIGIGLYDTGNTIDYLRKETGTNMVEHIETVFKHNKGRYPVLCAVPGISLVKHVGKRLDLVANISYIVNLHSLSAEYRRTDAYTREVRESHTLSIRPGHFLRLGIGIGIQLGSKR